MSGKEVGGVGVVAGAEVGHHDGNVGVHCRRCAGVVGWVGAGGEGEGEGEGSRDGHGGDGDGEAEEAEESGEMSAGVEKDGDREMEVEETLKEMEKSVDEAVMEE